MGLFDSKQKVESSPWGPVQAPARQHISQIGDVYAQTQGLNPYQQQGIGSAADYAQSGLLANQIGTAQGMNQWFAGGGAMDVGNNPYLQSAISAAIDPVFDRLQEDVLPGIGHQFSQASPGGWGSSKEGIAQGMAIDRATENALNTASGMANRGYYSGLGAAQNAIGQTGQVAGYGFMPGQSMMDIGDYQFQSQWAPEQMYAGLLGGYGGMGGTSTTTSTPSLASQIGMLGQTAAGMYGAFGG